ncbi:MAG: Rieske (2Fe-2S) protein [Alphaproteobacteria bacterium]|nr:Rieske (2Fe-2S) protein [Alphaproteobacteria bacterium]
MSTDLIALKEIEDGEAKRVDGPTGEVVVVRQGDGAVAYINVCPHLGTPLQMDDDEFVTDDGAHLACMTHAATFRISDGFCTSGPCEGDTLESVPVTVVDGMVKLA